MLLKATIPVGRGNAAINDRSIQQIIQKSADALKPEAMYFFPSQGQRCAMFIFDMVEASDLVAAVEPLWLALEADIDLVPCMNIDDLQAGFQKAFG
jgi:hypothetical protein